MPRKSVCSFCGYDVPIGRGFMYVRKDGRILHFCSKKCKISMLEQKKNPRKTRWTKFYGKE